MTRDQINQALATICTCLLDNTGIPEGVIYAALSIHGYSIDDYHEARNILHKVGWIEIQIPGPKLKLTRLGRTKARTIDTQMKRQTP